MEPVKLVTYPAACDRGRENLAKKTLTHKAVAMAGGGAAGATAAFKVVRWLGDKGNSVKPGETYPGPREICGGRCGLTEEYCDGKFYVADFIRHVGWHSRPNFNGPDEQPLSGAFRVEPSTGRRLTDDEVDNELMSKDLDDERIIPRPEWSLNKWRLEEFKRWMAEFREEMTELEEWLQRPEGADLRRALEAGLQRDMQNRQLDE